MTETYCLSLCMWVWHMTEKFELSLNIRMHVKRSVFIIIITFLTNKRKENKSLSILSTWHGNPFVLICLCEIQQGVKVSDCRTNRSIKTEAGRMFLQNFLNSAKVWKGSSIYHKNVVAVWDHPSGIGWTNVWQASSTCASHTKRPWLWYVC